MSGDDFDPTRGWDDCGDKDPGSHSPRLRYDHQRLWCHRPLPGLDSGRSLVLEPSGKGLIDTGLGLTFFGTDEGLYLTSDRTMATRWGWRATAGLRESSNLMERILEANPLQQTQECKSPFGLWPVGGGSIDRMAWIQPRGSEQMTRD